MYQSGAASLLSFGAAAHASGRGLAWTFARILLELTGLFFGLYLLVALGLTLTAIMIRRRGTPTAGPGPRPGQLSLVPPRSEP